MALEMELRIRKHALLDLSLESIQLSETITVSTPPHFDGNVSFTVNDQGEQGLGGSLEDLHTVG